MVTRKDSNTLALLCFCLLLLMITSCGTVDEKEDAMQVKTPVKEEPRVSAVFSRAKLVRNMPIKPEQIEVRQIPVSDVPRNIEYAASIGELKNAIAERDIDPGTILLSNMYSYNVIDRLSEIVTPGKVAISIPTNASKAMAFLAPNDKVDIIGSYTLWAPGRDGSGKSTLEEFTSYIGIGCRVLAVHTEFLLPDGSTSDKEDHEERDVKETIRNPYKGRKEIRSVTVEVDSQTAQKIAMLSQDLKTSSIRLAAHSQNAGVNDARDLTVSDYFLSRETEEETARTQARDEGKQNVPYNKITIFSGGKTETKHWSEDELNQPYDEDKDAPLQQ